MSTRHHEEAERRRVELQATLDSAKSQAERNRLGQFATPRQLASDILRLAKALLPVRRPVRFFDPAFGTGAFYSALLASFPASRIVWAKGYEIDPHYGRPANALWQREGLQLTLGDFTSAEAPLEERDKATLVVCNPPYVRHHHLDVNAKHRLRFASLAAGGIELNGLAGLYCHFVALCHAWMAKDALAIWLIPSEFMGVNYGRSMKEYLLSRVTLLRVHRFDPAQVQFGDALVSSAVVVFRNAKPPERHAVKFTYGGSLGNPAHGRWVVGDELRAGAKWTGLATAPEKPVSGNGRYRLADLFTVTRGIATGANDFFILAESRVQELGLPRRFMKPILPGPRFLRVDEVEADDEGRPLVEPRLLLLDCRVSEEEVRERYPGLWQYLESGRDQGIHERYLCKHREPWYLQESRQPAPILCTYMGRSGEHKAAFRFILNRSRAVAANVYLMLYPKGALATILRDRPDVLRTVWSTLNAMPRDVLLGVGRVYGGGLHKIEPKELAEAPADALLGVLPGTPRVQGRQLALAW